MGALSVARWAPAMLVASGVIQYVGASFAVRLFGLAPDYAVAWGRFCVGALLLLLVRRRLPRNPRGNLTARRWGLVAFFGLMLASMNVLFYMAISRLPLGAVVALEYLGPVMVAALFGRGWRVRVGVVLACAGVFLISWTGNGINVLGVVLAVAAGACWAAYIVLGQKVAGEGASIDSLAWGMLIAGIVYAPIGAKPLIAGLPDLSSWGLMVLVGLFSSVIPYVIDMLIFGKIPSDRYALFSSLFPATSLLVGVVLLAQIPTFGEVCGLVCISVAVALVQTKGSSTGESGSSH